MKPDDENDTTGEYYNTHPFHNRDGAIPQGQENAQSLENIKQEEKILMVFRAFPERLFDARDFSFEKMHLGIKFNMLETSVRRALTGLASMKPPAIEFVKKVEGDRGIAINQYRLAPAAAKTTKGTPAQPARQDAHEKLQGEMF